MSEPVDLYLLTLAGLVKARANGGGTAEVLSTSLDPDDVREVVPDPFNPRRLFAATVSDIYVSEDTWTFAVSRGHAPEGCHTFQKFART